VLAWAHTNTSWLNIELKPRREDAEMLADAVLRAMRDHALPALQSRMLLSSFSETAVSVLLARQSMIPIALLMEPGSRVPVSLRESTRLGVHPHHSMLISGSAWDLGNPPFVNTWTVNDTRAVQRVNFANVDGIITDDPLTLRNALE
jgi:glycerophosphoryl diester phosphodiesterase